jgi:DNA-binding MarR family transcriptional regulator
MNNENRERTFHKYMRTSKIMFHKTNERLERVGLSRGQPPLLMSLWKKDKQSRRNLCESMDRKPATITKMVKRLENNGFVTSFTQNSI